MRQWFRQATTLGMIVAIAVLMTDIIASSWRQSPQTEAVRQELPQTASAAEGITMPTSTLTSTLMSTLTTAATSTSALPPVYEYIEITDSCGPYHEGACLVARTGPGLDYPKVGLLRSGMVLKTSGSIEVEGRTWYKIVFDEWLRYPDRISTDLYVAADFVSPIQEYGSHELTEGTTSSKRIVVDRSDQKLYAYDGTVLVDELTISTGLDLTPTPRGYFKVYRKTPTRYMQGPIPDISDQYYDLPGVPWNLYFTEQGAVIHGAYWHDKFGEPWSHGCVNVAPQEAKKLYEWADLGTEVLVRD